MSKQAEDTFKKNLDIDIRAFEKAMEDEIANRMQSKKYKQGNARFYGAR